MSSFSPSFEFDTGLCNRLIANDESLVGQSPIDESLVDQSPIDESSVDESPIDESDIDKRTDEPKDKEDETPPIQKSFKVKIISHFL